MFPKTSVGFDMEGRGQGSKITYFSFFILHLLMINGLTMIANKYTLYAFLLMCQILVKVQV